MLRGRLRGWFDNVRSDVSHAGRSLLRRPTLTAAAVLMIAIGIGAAASIYSVVDAVVLRPLPYRAIDRLVVVGERDSLRNLSGPTSYPSYREWREQSQSFESLAAVTSEVLELTLTGRGEPTRVRAAAVSGTFFDTLGGAAAMGRALVPEDDVPDTTSLVLSHALWTRRFGADPAVIGQPLNLGGRSYTIAGVMP